MTSSSSLLLLLRSSCSVNRSGVASSLSLSSRHRQHRCCSSWLLAAVTAPAARPSAASAATSSSSPPIIASVTAPVSRTGIDTGAASWRNYTTNDDDAPRVQQQQHNRLLGKRMLVGSANSSIILCTSSTPIPQLQHHTSLRRHYHQRHYRNQQQQRRTYLSRAHPRQIPEYSVWTAVGRVLDDVAARRAKRQRKFDTNMKKKAAGDKISTNKTSVNHPDETVELTINVNVDPRKPGQALRGTVMLPNGSGRTFRCLVLTSDDAIVDLVLGKKDEGENNDDDAAAAAAAPPTPTAVYAGGASLVQEIVDGSITFDMFDKILATPDIMPTVTKQAARILGPRGLMPSAKVGTIIDVDDAAASEKKESVILEALARASTGRDVVYRTEKEGIVHVPVGKASFGRDKLLENIGAIMKELHRIKPENYGKGKKKGGSKNAPGKATKYLLRASLCSTQSRGNRIDLRTLDPGNVFFLSPFEDEVVEEDDDQDDDDDDEEEEDKSAAA